VVKEWLLDSREAMKKGVLVKDEQITVSGFLDRFISDVVAHTLKPKTVDSYKFLIEKHIKPEIGHYKLSRLRSDQIQTLYSKKLNSGLSERTVQYIHAVLRRALNFALKWGLIYRNPTDVVEAPRPKKKAPEVLSEDQAKHFLETVKEHRWYPIYVLAIATGMREGEILGLRWEDVDLEHATISVRKTVQSIRGKIIIGEPKTQKSRRTISLPDFAVEVLSELEKSEGFVFTTASGRPVSPRNLLRHFHESLEKAGLPHFRFHDLRHTCATLLLKENVHPKVVQELLGHSSISWTLDTYSHTIRSMQEEAAQKMDGIFKV
jgi:integrase